jgi:hypothetical protein
MDFAMINASHMQSIHCIHTTTVSVLPTLSNNSSFGSLAWSSGDQGLVWLHEGIWGQ